MMTFEQLLTASPFSASAAEKSSLFLQAMRDAFAHHISHCPPFETWCQKRKLAESEILRVEDLPYLPAEIFKHMMLRSSGGTVIGKTLTSSATSSGVPSQIFIDEATAKRQRAALVSVWNDYLGSQRMPFIVFDKDPATLSAAPGSLSARSGAIRGFLIASKGVDYVMQPGQTDDCLMADIVKLTALLKKMEATQEPFCLFGFTYIVYHFAVRKLLDEGIRFQCPNARLIHIGGWKKLQDQSVSKTAFNRAMEDVFGVKNENVIDVYGFTEQLGLIYPDCPFGVKHVPTFSEVIVRNPSTLMPVPDTEEGLLQFLTPMPLSYPGISVITGDVGKITNRERCRCGRLGTSFVVMGRAANVEPRGCGDILAEKSKLTGQG